MPVNFILPDLFEMNQINQKMANLQLTHMDVFINPKIRLIGQMGSFPFHSWNGGKINTLNSSRVLLKHDLEQFAQNNSSPLAIYYDCSNIFLLETDYNDRQENTTLQILQNGSNKIIVSTVDMAHMIREKYPQFYLIASEDYFLYNQDLNLDLFHGFILNYLDLTTNEELQKIPKSKIIIDITTSCKSCQNYKSCREREQTNQLCYAKQSVFLQCKQCRYEILAEGVLQDLQKQGYTNFCFSTNGLNPIDLGQYLQVYLDLFIKPECKDMVDLYLRGAKVF